MAARMKELEATLAASEARVKEGGAERAQLQVGDNTPLTTDLPPPWPCPVGDIRSSTGGLTHALRGASSIRLSTC